MANIPVERTKTTPWWLWLLGLLLLAGLIWFLLEAFDDDDEIVDTTEEVVETPIAAALDLSDVWVTRVVGDNTFFVAPTEGGTDETLVYLEEEPTPGDATEGRYDVTAGQHLAITGSMEATPADLTPWGLTADQAAMVGDQYVRATSLTILDGDMADGEMIDDDLVEGDVETGEVTGLAALRGDLAQMAGRPVQLDDVRVTALAGDSTFYVGDGADRVLIVLESLGESQSGGGDGSDGAFNVDVGDVVDIRGEVKAFQRGMRGSSTLAEADLAAAETRRFVVVVNDRGDFSKN